MKCFMHGDVDAISVCKKCGKAMCAKCSAYSGHSGVCPQCRKENFERERQSIWTDLESLKWATIGWAVCTIALCWTIIGGIYGGYKWYKCQQEKEVKNSRLSILDTEIDKLNKALRDRGTKAFT